MSKTYRINECFYSLQGEGMRAGCPSVFIRFSGCNLRCDVKEGPKSPGGFACDTEFESGRTLTLEEIADWVGHALKEKGLEPGQWKDPWIVLTGGEPGLQVDRQFCDFWHAREVKLAIETNGTIELPYETVGDGVRGGQLLNERKMYLLDWITLSPKVAEHAVKQPWATEIKYVRGFGQGIPKPATESQYKLISPAFAGNELDKQTLEWCISLCLQHPEWRLSVQNHKAWQVR